MRSASIVFFKFTSSMPDPSKPYLVGFEYARPLTGETYHEVDMDVSKNIYRHPDRQNAPKEDFSMTHDIYALGVVLLEIGLWKAAVDIYKEDNGGIEPRNSRIEEARKSFLKAAREQLPRYMGPAYARAVEICLSDELAEMEEMTNFGSIFLDSVVRNLEAERLSDET